MIFLNPFVRLNSFVNPFAPNYFFNPFAQNLNIWIFCYGTTSLQPGLGPPASRSRLRRPGRPQKNLLFQFSERFWQFYPLRSHFWTSGPLSNERSHRDASIRVGLIKFRLNFDTYWPRSLNFYSFSPFYLLWSHFWTSGPLPNERSRRDASFWS